MDRFNHDTIGSTVPHFLLDTNNLMLAALAVATAAMLAWTKFARAQRITPAQATQLINRRGAVVVDVRGADEFATGHLVGALNLPGAELGAVPAALRDKTVPVIVVCRSGVRADGGCAALQKAGYAEVYNLDGGVEGWLQAGYPLAFNRD